MSKLETKQYKTLAAEYLAWCIANRKEFQPTASYSQCWSFLEQMHSKLVSKANTETVLYYYNNYIMPVYRKRMASGEGMGPLFGRFVVSAGSIPKIVR